jgi:hypothetical protein
MVLNQLHVQRNQAQTENRSEVSSVWFHALDKQKTAISGGFLLGFNIRQTVSGRIV